MKLSNRSVLAVLLKPGLALCLSLSAANAADWLGGTSTDWNTGSNWAGGVVPTGQNAIINNTTGAIATISANLSVTPNDIDIRNGSRLDHIAGIAGTNGGSWMFVGQDNSAGTYNLANTGSVGGGITGFAQGSGSLNATGNLLVGAFGDNRTGTVNVNTTGTLAVSGELFIGDSMNSIGNFKLESGTMTVNNKIFIGNNKGAGTLTMSGGTLTKTGGDETFVGRDQGTGTLTQSGGTITLNHSLYVGQSSGSNGTLNISGTAVLNAGRDFVIGRESGTGTLNMTGGTITKTGDEKFIVGHNNGVGIVVQSGGTISANNELYIGNENASASGTYTLSGTGALNVSNEVVVGREGGTGILNVNGGTLTTSGNGNMYVGRRNGTGTLNQTAGTISVNREFGVGTRDDNKIGTGTYNLSGTGVITVANNIFIGKEQGSSGTMVMTGGTMTGSDKLIVGHNQATGILTQSGGTVTVSNEVYIGNENSVSSVGTYTLSGSAALNVGNEVVVGRDNGMGTFNLNGGTVTTKKIEGGNGSATVNFNGGTMKAKEDQSNFITNLDVANVQVGGAVINSNGFKVGTDQVFTGAGGFNKVGAGSLELRSASTNSGSSTVTTGTLVANNASGSATGTGTLTVNSGAQLSGTGRVETAANNYVYLNGTLQVGDSTLGSPTASSFTVATSGTGSFSTGAGSTILFDLFSVGGDLSSTASAADYIRLFGTMDPTLGTTFIVGNPNALSGFAAGDKWSFFDLASGSISANVTVDYSALSLGSGLTGSFDRTNGIFSISTAAIPEPSRALLMMLGFTGVALRRRRLRA
jgi:hypothetical protein